MKKEAPQQCGVFVYSEYSRYHTEVISHLIQTQGTCIQVREYGSAQKPAVLLVHGWGDTIERADRFVQNLSKHFHVYTYSLPGYGASWPDRRAQSITFLASLIDPICKELEIHPWLVGYSLGCAVISRYLEEREGEPIPTVLVGAPLQPTNKPLVIQFIKAFRLIGLVRSIPFLRDLTIGLARESARQLSKKLRKNLHLTHLRESTPVGLFDTIFAAMDHFPNPDALSPNISYIYGKHDLLIPLTKKTAASYGASRGRTLGSL